MKAFRKSHAILCQTCQSMRKWDCAIWESFFVLLCLMLQFCLPVSNFFCSQRSLQKNVCHVLPNIWDCEKVWLGFESDFCLTFPNALSIVPSISNFGAPQKNFGSLPKVYWGPLKLLLVASQNFIGSLPKCWSILKLLNVMLRFGSNLKIFLVGFILRQFGSLGPPKFGSLPKGLNDMLSQEAKNA